MMRSFDWRTMSAKDGMLAGEGGIGFAEAFLAGRVDEQAGHLIGEVVAGGAFHRPFLAQRLVARQDLLDHQIEALAGRLGAQAAKVAVGVEQAVDMVDAQPVHRAVGQQAEGKPVDVVEHLGQLHAQAGEVVDVEEAAIVDVVGGDAEMRDAASADPGSAHAGAASCRNRRPRR